MTRIRDKIKWTETFRLIEKGADPYGDKKEVFSIDNLKRFFEQGLHILSGNDLHLIKTMEGIVNDSEVFNREISEFLNIEFVEDLDLQKLTAIIDRFRLGKLYLSPENYEELSSLHNNSNTIVTFNKFKNSDHKFPYADIKQLHNSITDSGLTFNIPIIADELLNAEKWVQGLWEAVGDYKITTTLNKDIELDDLNPKLTLNSKLVEKMYQLLYKSEFSFSDTDLYVNSSSYTANFKSETEEENETSKFYCVCREYEFGTMIECDTCNEWYHIQCVNEKEDDHAKEEDSYLCPTCKLIDSEEICNEYLNGQLTLQAANKVLQEGHELKVYPTNELNVLKELCVATSDYSTKYHLQIEELKEGTQSTEAKLDILRFILRKVYASGLLAKDLLENVLITIRAYDKELKDQILAEALTESLREDNELETFTGLESSTGIENLIVAELPSIENTVISGTKPNGEISWSRMTGSTEMTDPAKMTDSTEMTDSAGSTSTESLTNNEHSSIGSQHPQETLATTSIIEAVELEPPVNVIRKNEDSLDSLAKLNGNTEIREEKNELVIEKQESLPNEIHSATNTNEQTKIQEIDGGSPQERAQAKEVPIVNHEDSKANGTSPEVLDNTIDPMLQGVS
jgi:Chromatin remodeling protein, contains PhD zinc finger